ncbi:MAG TPA: hypothetical protein VGI61_10605, partial [Parafilimonas sp.]
AVNITGIEFSETENKKTGVQQNILINKSNIGTITKIDTTLLDKFDIKQNVVFVELNYKSLLSANAEQKIIFKGIAQHPAVERDLALIVDKKIKYNNIENLLKQLGIPFLQQFSLFDIFESDKIGKNKKSLAINFTFLNAEKTLTDTDVNEMMKRIVSKFEHDLNAEIRK